MSGAYLRVGDAAEAHQRTRDHVGQNLLEFALAIVVAQAVDQPQPRQDLMQRFRVGDIDQMTGQAHSAAGLQADRQTVGRVAVRNAQSDVVGAVHRQLPRGSRRKSAYSAGSSVSACGS